MNRLLSWFNILIKKRRKLKRWQRIVTVLAAMITFVTTYALILPAITVEKDRAEEVGGMYLEQEEDEDDLLEENALEFTGVSIAADQENAVTYEYADDDMTAVATFSTDEEIPEGAELVVNPVDTESVVYADLSSRAALLLDREFIYDVTTCSFFDYALICDGADVTPKTGLVDVQINFLNNTVNHVDDVVYAGRFGRPAESAEGFVATAADITEETTDAYVGSAGDSALADPEDFLAAEDELVSANPDESSVLELTDGIITVLSLKGNDLAQNDSVVGILAGNVDEEAKEAAAETDAEVPTADDIPEESSAPEVKTLMAAGNDYIVTLTCDENSGVPEGATLAVSEIAQDTKEYKTYLEKTKKAMGLTEEEILPRYAARFFDIKIMVGNKEFKPESGVAVEITYDEPLAENPETEVSAVHFANKKAKADVIEANATDVQDNGAATVEFMAESFSVYGVIYTVDFSYSVNGKTYEFSLPGGGFVSFTDLIEVLGITGDTNTAENETKTAPLTLDEVEVSEETREFVADVESVEFSNPDLVWIGKVEADSTVGRLKKANGLECQYSSELSEEQIAVINAQTVEAGDWALISMLPFDTEESLIVTMKNREQFVVKVTDARDPLGLDGRSFSIVNYRNNNWYALRGQRNTNTQNTRGYYLFADSVSHTIANNTEYCGVEADAWLFEYNADEDAYYVSCNGMYLYIDPTIESKNDSTPNNNYAHALDLKAEKDQSDKGTLLKISRDDDGNYIFKSNSEKITLWDYNNAYWLSNQSQETGNEYLNSHMRLCLPEASGNDAPHKATLISAADTQPGQKIIVYQRVLDPTTDTFTYYAINGTGGMEKVYNSSDSVYWKGDLNIEWTLKDLGNGYYTLYNEKEQTYLTPKASTGTNGSYVVHKASDFDDSKHLSISLPGRDDGTYTSLISCWDYVDNATYGLKASETTQGGQVAIEPLLSSQQFYFAARDPIVHDQLTTVDTVDSVSKGIKITMYDWGEEHGFDSHRQPWDGSNPWIQDRLPAMQNVMGADGTYADKYESGKVKPGILADYIDKDAGQTAPNVLKEDGTLNGHNLSELFSDSYIRSGSEAEKVNHLFLQSVYDETGFFKYSCFENYAYLPNGNDFTVYEQIGTPSNRTSASTATNIIYERGNFMPYNPINAAMNYRQNNYDPDLKELPDGDPRKGERLYYIENALPSGGVWYDGNWYNGSSNPEAYANYYLGMKMEAKFSQNPGGYADNGDPMIFEFNGDDDLWIYLDNVLVLDMGGVHDAFRGKINFRTGDVTCNALNGENTTIKAMFKKAGRFPDGTEWDDARVNEYFRGNTFKDFTTHNFKMFYMERGASASDLELMFNLPVLAESQFRIKKELPGTNDGEVVQSQYGDAPFYYKAYVYDAEARSMVTCTRQYLSSKGLDTPKYEDGSEVEWLTTNSNEEIFLIKPGQTALFPAIDDSVRWYTEEVAPPQNENMLKKFSVSNSDQDNDINYEVGVKSKERTILVRNMVIYQNRPDTELVNELQIKKKINGNAYNADDSFEYRIYLEKTDGKLGVYRLGEYYQFDKDNNFVFYENGVRHTAKMEVLSNGHYRYYDFDDGRPEETVEVQKITEHTSTNGSVGDVRDGDTIIIKGLLVGTDFYVYERTDYSYMSPDSTPVEGKYVFEGTDVTDAYTRNPETNKPENELIFNSLYGPPDSEAINNYPHSAYEREKAASGAIIEHKDAKILVKNKPYLEIPEGTISVEKKWLDEDNHDITSTVTDKSVTYDIYRLVHVHEMECIVDQEPTDTEPGVQHFECKHDGCNYELPPEQIEPKGHQWSEWEEKHRKTCTEQGIWERHCLNPGCNATETWTEEPLGHDWDDGVITQPATTTQTGIRHHVCQNDSSHTWDEEIPKLAGNITYHIRSMYNHGQALQIDSYPGDGTIAAGTGNAIRVSYTLKSNNPDEQYAYGNSSTQAENIPKTQKYIDYNYYYDYSVTIPIEEGNELYLYLGNGYNSSRSNFKIEVIEYYDVNTMNARPMLFSKSSAARARGPQKNSASDGPTNNAELNAKLAQIGYSETDEQTHAVVNHNFYQWEKYDSASQSWKTDGVSTETLLNGRWSKSYTVPLTDENGNPYEYYFIEKSITPEGEAAHWTTTYSNQDGGLTAAGTVTINNKKVPETGSLLITKNVTYNGGTPVPAGKQSYVNKDFKFTITKDGTPIAQSPVTISVTNGSSNEILIDNLEPGDYEIIEADSAGLRLTGFSGGKAQDTGKKSVTVTVTAGKITKEQLEEAAKATFVNDYSETSVTLKKTDVADLNAANPNLLKGASFKITKYKTAEFQAIDDKWGESGSKTLVDAKDEVTGEYSLNGSFTFTDMPAGFYKIEEKVYPAGYIKLDSDPCFEIGEDMKVYLLNSNGQRIGSNATETIKVMPVGGAQTDNIIRVGNTPGATLPNTGGRGTNMLYLLGIMLIGVAFVGFVMKRRWMEAS